MERDAARAGQPPGSVEDAVRAYVCEMDEHSSQAYNRYNEKKTLIPEPRGERD